MNHYEQDILKKIEEKTQEIPVPESLQPDQVLQKLEGMEEQRRAENVKKMRHKIYWCGTLVAACLAVAAGIYVYQGSGAGTGAGTSTGSTSGKQAEKTIDDSRIIARAEDYEDAYGYLEACAVALDVEGDYGYATDYESASAVEYAATEDSAKSTSTASGGDYSETNVRQYGVDEGDIVKTDGTYLYILRDNTKEIAIVDTRNNDLKEVQNITPEDIDVIRELYLNTKTQKLTAVCEVYGDALYDTSGYRNTQNTVAITYDITDKESPKESGRVTQNGGYYSSRESDGYIYIFSNYAVSLDGIQKSEPETYIPLVNDKIIAAEDIYLPSVSQAYTYSVVTAIDLEQPDETYDSKAILSDGGEVYVSNENIYYYETVWDSTGGTKTTLRRIAYKDGRLEAGAQGQTDGYINDSYSIDEYEGYLRIVLTDDDENCVRILNQDLEEVGAVEDLAKDEQVYSARLMGDIGYFVTFRQTDPLFSVDLSDPENPEIIGSLKIPGFSEYLHPYGDGKLLGIGMDADEETGVSEGVKLTMFDISDPSDVKEVDTYILENVYSTDVSYDYKAALVDTDKNLIGFAGYTEGMEEYFLFSYDENNGFICHMEEEINGNSMLNARGIYIDDILYVVRGNVIESYSLKDYQKTGDLIL